ncbi:MAG: hypothetical protein GPOALKHO_001113 [Sodalis sp.]|nr:MAG: hypothetical protein GPOALKHO_001113 [Sodalis sp.]
MRKPDQAIYRYVLEQEGAMADGAVFFDDNTDKLSCATSFHRLYTGTGDVIQCYLERFILHSSRMTALGICGLIVTAPLANTPTFRRCI